MGLRQDIPALLSHIKNQADLLSQNDTLIDIFEGNLLPYVLSDLRKQLNPKSYEAIKYRVPPVNLLKKLVDKLSGIYRTAPARVVAGGSDKDMALLDSYEKSYSVNSTLQLGNELFNLCKATLLQPYVHNGSPKLRAIPNNRFVVWSKDPIETNRPTHVVLIDMISVNGKAKRIFRAYTDDEILVFDEDENVLPDMMAAWGNPDGVNPVGRLPFVYVPRSKLSLIPSMDTDMLTMVKLFPVLLADLNFASMYSCFSLIYGIDLDVDKIEFSPNAFLDLKSDKDSDKKPELGMLKPQADISETLNLIQSQLALWLHSRGVRPGAVGQLSTESFSSGVSKMVDEMDTADDRQKQVTYFQKAEEELWDLSLHTLQPFWASQGLVLNRTVLTPSAQVEVQFVEQVLMGRRGELIAELNAEVEAGFNTRLRAIKRLNPHMSEKELADLQMEIKAEKDAARPDFSRKEEDEDELARLA